jgi:5-methylcytosine-specific restriction endonuclease McrA
VAPDGADEWLKVSRAVKKRDGYRCRRCGARRQLSAHHIKPRAQGGTDSLRNLLTLCAACHDYAEPEASD